MAMNKQQQRIFDSPITHDVAVSAGAGTGKSTTLKNKVIDLIKTRKVKPSEFLIVTFTNDAASSLRNKIKQEIRKDPTLADLISEVDAMHIDTLDAYRLFIVKKYAKKLGIAGNIGIINASIYKLEQSKMLDELLDDLYKKQDPVLTEYFEEFVTKNDKDMRSMIVSMSDYMSIDGKTKDSIITKYYDDFLSDEIIKNKLNKYLNIIFDGIVEKANQIIEILDDVEEEFDKKGNVVVNPKAELMRKRVDSLLDAKTNDEIIKGLKEFHSIQGNFKAGKSFEGYKEAKALYDEIDKTKYTNIDDLFNIDLKFNQRIIPLFLSLAYDLKLKMDSFMKLHSLYRFSDIASLSLKVLEDKDSLEEIKNSFKVVMIDEYQDNSDLDDEFFTKIANNNLFVVGDVKQSIYGFKGANPEKFTLKYNQTSLDNKSLYNEEPYTMNINYRSRVEILKGVNDIFSNFMDLTFGGVEYKKDHHELNYDNNFMYDNCPQPDEKDKGLKQLMSLDNQSLIDKYNKITGENENEQFAKDNKFLLTCALNILSRINNHEKVVGPNNCLRDATFGDFAVLSRGNPNSENAREIFTKLGLPVNVIADEEITKDTMVVTILSILEACNIIIKNEFVETNICNQTYLLYKDEKKLKCCLVSILRSFLYETSDQEIFDLFEQEKKEKDTIPNLSYRESRLYKKLVAFCEKEKSSSLYDFAVNVFIQFNFLEKLPKLGNAINLMNRFSLLLEQIKGMDDICYQLEDLIFFFDKINELDLKIEIRLGLDSNNAVTVETIHKSKGLEFPIVYVECSKNFKSNCNMKRKSSYFVNPKYGYYLPRKTFESDGDAFNSAFFIDDLASLENLNNSISEETRLFYVALTRAKETAICVYNEDLKITIDDPKEMATTYQKIVFLSKQVLQDDEYGYADQKLIEQTKKEMEKETVEIKENQVTYNPITNKINKPSIKSDLDEDDELLLTGIRYHAYMQYVDFISKDTSFIEDEKERKDIDKVLKNPLFDESSKGKVYKEYKYFDEELNQTGVIDLLIIYKDKALVVDYKLKYADEEKYSAQLLAYKSYIEKVFNLPTDTMLLSLLGN